MQEDITLAQLKRGDHQTFSRLFNLYHRDLVLYAGATFRIWKRARILYKMYF